MALIEYTNIESITGSTSSFQWFYTILGVGVGFGLNQVATKIKSNREINEAGNNFEAQLKILKESLKEQIDIIEDCQLKIKSFDDYEMVFITEFSFDFLFKIDAFKVIKYYKKEELDKDPSRIISYIENAKMQIKNLINLNKEYISNIDTSVSKYEQLLEDIGLEIKRYRDRNSVNKIPIDKIAQDLEVIFMNFISGGQSDAKTYVNFLSTLHKQIRLNSIYSNFKHILYEKTNRFDLEGFRIGMAIIEITNEYENKLDLIVDTLKEVYENIYDEDYPDVTDDYKSDSSSEV